MRYCDDLSDSDDVADRPAAIAGWQKDLDAALSGQPSEHPLWRRSLIPTALSISVFSRHDQGVSRIRNRGVCRRFRNFTITAITSRAWWATTIIHIFGFENPEALRLASDAAWRSTHQHPAMCAKMPARPRVSAAEDESSA
jgi:hypothetical protein